GKVPGDERVAVLPVEVEIAELRPAEQAAARHRERAEQERGDEHRRPQRKVRTEHAYGGTGPPTVVVSGTVVGGGGAAVVGAGTVAGGGGGGATFVTCVVVVSGATGTCSVVTGAVVVVGDGFVFVSVEVFVPVVVWGARPENAHGPCLKYPNWAGVVGSGKSCGGEERTA